MTDADLTDADLSEANLTRANLTRAILAWANLTRANLTEANLTEANLTRAILAGANLTRANLTEANLRWANLTEANMRGANLRGADLRRAIGNMADVKSMQIDTYQITWWFDGENDRLAIGCQSHTVEAWKGFTDAEIRSMDGKKALDWWRKWKDDVIRMIEKSPQHRVDAE